MILAARVDRCGQREGTGLENSCALRTGPARRSARCRPQWALAPPPAAPSPGPRPALAVILATLVDLCCQGEGTSLGSSRAVGTTTVPKIHTPRPAVKPWHRLRQFQTLGTRPALAAILAALVDLCGQRKGTSLGSSRALGTGPARRSTRCRPR